MTEPVVRSAANDRKPGAGRHALLDGWSLAVVVLSAVYPIVRFFAGNAERLVWLAPVFGDGLLWVSLTLVAFIGVRLLTRATPPLVIAAAFAAFNLAFWNFARFLPVQPETAIRRWMGIAVWIVAAAALVRVAMLLGRRRYTGLFLVAFLVLWDASLMAQAISARSATSGGDVPELVDASGVTLGDHRPNVYWLLFDQHARSDQLLAHTGSDNRWFDSQLADRGFSVSTSSTSSYLQTHLSVTSTLGMGYAWTPGHDYRSDYGLAAPIINGANPVVETFERNGYRYVGAPDGRIEWARCPEPGPSRSCIEPLGSPLALREPHSYLVWATPVGSLNLPTTHNSLASVELGIEELHHDDQPFFLYAHILSPHFPYRYDTDCSIRPAWVDGNHFTRDEHAASFANETQCLDREIVSAVDRIVARDPDAVIIVQSDHGSDIDFSFGVPYQEVTDAELLERFAVLNAIRLPEPCRGDPIEGEPLVNTFPLVLTCLGGEGLELFEPRHFFTEFGKVRTIQEVEGARHDAVNRVTAPAEEDEPALPPPGSVPSGPR